MAAPALGYVDETAIGAEPDTLERGRVPRLSWGGWVSAAIVVAAIAMAISARWIAPHPPTDVTLADRLRPIAFVHGGTLNHLLGTDNLGRDVLSRMIYGAQASFLVGFGAVAISLLVGTAIGLVAGYRGGWLDDVLMTVADIQLALPGILLAMGVIAVLGPSLTNLVIVIGITGWVTFARVVRALVLKWRSEEFVTAARALGAGQLRIMLRHILPNCVPALIILATLDLPRAIITEATLSFLGIGVQPPQPSWGNMIGDGRLYLVTAPWIALAPGIALVIVTVSISHLGDRLREALDPTLKTLR